MGADRQMLLWALVVFFGASLAFNAINDLTDGEQLGVRIAAQIVALAAILALVVLVARRRR